MDRPFTAQDFWAAASACDTREQAQALLMHLSAEFSRQDGLPQETVLVNLRANLGYFAGYYAWDDRERVARLFDAYHPFLPHRQVTAEEAMKIGLEMGKQIQTERDQRRNS